MDENGLPLKRMSVASMEEESFFTPYPSQPASRLMSVFMSRDSINVSEDVNSARRYSEPLVSVCLPHTGTTQSSPSKDKDDHGPGDVPDSQGPSCDISPTGILHRLDEEDGSPGRCIQQRTPSCDDVTSPMNSAVHVEKLISSPAPVVMTRCWSSVPHGDEAFDAWCYPDCSPVVTRAQLDGLVAKEDMDVIISDIRAYLSSRSHSDYAGGPDTTATNENLAPSSPFHLRSHHIRHKPDLSADHYLITTDEIAGIIDIVIASLSRPQQDDANSDCQSLVFPNETHARPSFGMKNIIPGFSTLADPTTTICSARPFFSFAGQSEWIEHPEPRPHTTYISRQSIREIN